MFVPLPWLDLESTVVKIVLFALFMGGSLVVQAFNAWQEAQKKKNAGKPASPLDDALRRELKEMARGRQGSGGERPRDTRSERGGSEGAKKRKGGGKPSVKEGSRSGTNPPPLPSQREGVERGRSVAEHVQRHLTEGGIASRNVVLGEATDQADERIESHLHQVFDHRVGQLDTDVAPISEGTDADTWRTANESRGSIAQQLRDVLTSPSSAASAVILSEILQRPTDRWK